MLVETTAAGEVVRTYHDPNHAATYALAHGSELSDGRYVLGTFAGKHMVIVDVGQA